MKENFENMEVQLQSVIQNCSEDNKLSISSADVTIYGVGNATEVAHFLIGDLHVYEFRNGDTPIDWWFSTKSLVSHKKGEVILQPSSCIEYSIGGDGNSLPVDRVNTYCNSKFIGVAIPNSDGSKLDTDIIAPEGKTITGYGFNRLGYMKKCFGKKESSSNIKDYNSGNLFEYILKLDPENAEEKEILDTLKTIIGDMEAIALNKKTPSEAGLAYLKELIKRVA